MPSFWSYIGNDRFNIGCTGQTVYVYDKAGKELARFKDLIYAYLPVISPRGDHFVVKTTDGRMAVYSLETLSLVKKFRYSKVDGAQDDIPFHRRKEPEHPLRRAHQRLLRLRKRDIRLRDPG